MPGRQTGGARDQTLSEIAGQEMRGYDVRRDQRLCALVADEAHVVPAVGKALGERDDGLNITP
jgi:hypothetical protein